MASERSMEGFLKSILEQILRQEPRLFACLMEDFARHLNHRCQRCFKDGEMGWTLRSLKSALKTIIVTGDSKIQTCLFVDALDECDTSVKDVIVSLQQLMNDAKVHLKFYITSRTSPVDMLRMLPASQGFILQEHNSKDIFKFVNDKITSNLFPDHTDEANRIFIHDLNELKKEIIEKADGVFLWVDIVLSEIERGIDDGNTITELRENLRATPSELSGQRLNAYAAVVAVFLKQKLRRTPMNQATARPDMLCSSYISHSSLSRACLKYLCTRDIENVSTYLENLHDIPWEEKCSVLAENFPFLEYSATTWMKHCSQAEKLGAPQARYFDMFTSPSERYFEIWCEVHDRWVNPSKPLGIDITPMQLAIHILLADGCISGDEDMANLLLDHGANIEARRGDSDSILAAACRFGNVKIVRKILEARPDTSSYGLENGPLIAASISGNAEIIKALTLSNLEKILDASKDQPNFSLDHDDDEVSELLLSQGADFFTFGIDAPWIQCMLMNISSSTIKKLLTEDPEMCNRRARSGYTLFHLVCATTNDEAIVQLLLENGADSTAIADDGTSVFHLALSNLSESVLKCLLDMGFDPGAGDIYGVTPST
ncbi:ankyrin repeat-containing domain protein [Leptodontidium sp. 2 PMI_412]|nr:ankyrin repeat-containing domain protein [Leptodontidium sp. 2 PMI_412]